MDSISTDVPGCELWDVDYAASVDAIAHVPVAACSACAGVICVDVTKWYIAVCTYAWVRCHYGVKNSGYKVQGAGCRVQVGCKAS